jgi:hypothetical protein
MFFFVNTPVFYFTAPVAATLNYDPVLPTKIRQGLSLPLQTHQGPYSQHFFKYLWARPGAYPRGDSNEKYFTRVGSGLTGRH